MELQNLLQYYYYADLDPCCNSKTFSMDPEGVYYLVLRCWACGTGTSYHTWDYYDSGQCCYRCFYEFTGSQIAVWKDRWGEDVDINCILDDIKWRNRINKQARKDQLNRS